MLLFSLSILHRVKKSHDGSIHALRMHKWNFSFGFAAIKCEHDIWFPTEFFFDFAIMGSQSQSPHVDLNDALAEKPLCKITQANSQ